MKVENDVVIDNHIADGHDVVVWVVEYVEGGQLCGCRASFVTKTIGGKLELLAQDL